MNKKCREDAVSKTGSRSNPRIFAIIAKISLGLRKFRWDCENFVGIAKISLGLRKFRNHSENFAILAKLGIFARLAKFIVDIEISHFRYLCRISLG